MTILRALALLALVALTACGGGNGGGSVESDASEAIEQFDPSPRTRSRSLVRLSIAWTTDPEATRDAALEHLETEDPDVRFAAVYALGLAATPEDAAALATAAQAPELAPRLLAATAALSLGDAGGIPVLIDALGEELVLPVGSPALRAWEQARFALLVFTGQDFGLRAARSSRAAAATKPAWRRWWSAAEGSFEPVRAPDRFSR